MTARALLWAPLFVIAVACSGESTTTGADQPIRVRDAQFKSGSLPGVESKAGANPTGLAKPLVPAAGLGGGGQIIHVGEAGWVLTGRSSSDGVAVGVRIADAGSGYWLFPVGSADETNGTDFSWRVAADAAPDLSAGFHDLEFVAFDATGRAGTRFTASVCFESNVPDNLNACDPTSEPPYLVVSLDWDRPVDLDLRIVTPNGKVPDGKHPTTALPGADKKVDPTAPGVGILDRDANAGCLNQGLDIENMVWATKPTPGKYFVYANLYDACGQPSVGFNVSLHQREPGAEPNTFKVVEKWTTSASALAVEANAGTSLGLYVTEFDVK